MSLPRGPRPRGLFLPFVLTAVLVASLVALSGCSVGEFIGAYFNTYYNARRAFSEAETELLSAQDPKQADKGYLAPYTVPAGAKTKFTSVIEKCSKLLQYHPESAFVDDALLMIGKSYYYQNENQSAGRKFRELIENQPSSALVPEAKLLLANTLYRSGDTEGAKMHARAILEDEEDLFGPPIRSRAALLMGTIEADAKNYEPARQYYDAAAEDAETKEERFAARMRVAEMYRLLDDPQKAGETYTLALDDATDYLSEYRAWIGRARMQSAVGDHDDALDELGELLENVNNKEFFGEIDFEIGNVYRAMDDIQAAVDQYRFVDTAYVRTEFSARASYELGLLYEKELLQYDSARVAYSRGRGTAGQTPVAPLLATRFDAMTRYASLRADIARNDSLRLAILFPPDSLRADTLISEPASTETDTAALGVAAPADTSSGGGPAAPPQPAVVPDDTGDVMAAADSALQRSSPDSIAQKADSASSARPRWMPVAIPLDTVLARLALAESELGALFFNVIERNDSASYWFNKLLSDHPSSIHSPRALYTLAQIAIQDSDLARADSLYHILAEGYPQSEFGAMARRFLGIAEPADTTGGAAALYGSAEQLLAEGNNAQALEEFSKLVQEHPTSPLAPKAEYAIAWIYEEIVTNPESALVHYRSLVERFPTSDYAPKVKPKLDAVDQELRAREAANAAAQDSAQAREALAPPPSVMEPADSAAAGAPPDSVQENPVEEEPPPEVQKEELEENKDEPPPGMEGEEEPTPPPPNEMSIRAGFSAR